MKLKKNIVNPLSKAPTISLLETTQLIIEPVPDILTAIKMPKFAKITVKEFEKDRKEIAEEV
ncbi:MAG: hypothetical protein ACXQTX_06955, partial [Candidatus Syntropharchaeia archaeon]